MWRGVAWPGSAWTRSNRGPGSCGWHSIRTHPTGGSLSHPTGNELGRRRAGSTLTHRVSWQPSWGGGLSAPDDGGPHSIQEGLPGSNTLSPHETSPSPSLNTIHNPSPNPSCSPCGRPNMSPYPSVSVALSLESTLGLDLALSLRWAPTRWAPMRWHAHLDPIIHAPIHAPILNPSMHPSRTHLCTHPEPIHAPILNPSMHPS